MCATLKQSLCISKELGEYRQPGGSAHGNAEVWAFGHECLLILKEVEEEIDKEEQEEMWEGDRGYITLKSATA